MDSAALMDLWNAVEQVEPSPENVPWLRRAHAALVGAGTIERYMRPSPAPGVDRGAGGRPGASPKQLETWEIMEQVRAGTHPENKRIVAVSGSNQCGKTICDYCDWCLYLRDKAENGSIHWLIAASIDSIKGVPLRTIWQLLPRSMFGSWHYHPNQNLPTTIPLHLPNGRGVIELKPMTENQDLQEFEQERLSSWLWSECRREAIFHALQPRMAAHGAFGYMDYIPIEGWHRELEENALVSGSLVYHVRMAIVENQHNLSPGAVHDMKPKSLGGRGTMSIEEWRLRGEGIPAAYEGVVYKQFDPAVHVIKPYKVPAEWPLYMAGDWGYAAHHAIGLATVEANENVVVIAESYDKNVTVFDCCRRLWQMVSSFRYMALGRWSDEEAMFQALRREFNLPRTDEDGRPLHHDRPVAKFISGQWRKTLAGAIPMDALDIDQADGQQVLDEFWLCGLPVMRPMKTNIHGSVELVRRAFEQRRLFFWDTCPNIRRDHATWKYREDKDRIIDPDEKFDKKNKHGCDMVRYLLRSHPVHCPRPNYEEVDILKSR